jgi:uncharacterized protein
MSADAREVKILLQGPAGKLEALSSEFAEADQPLVGVVCHPHPLYQGTMNNKVVTTIIKAWTEMGLHTIRFNFRGVESSEGEYAEGIGEQDDLKAVLDWALKQNSKAKFWLGGFSFGSFVSAEVALDIRYPIKALLSVAPPVNHFEFSKEKLPSCPWVVIQGDEDEVVPYQSVVTWFNTLKNHQKNLQLITLKGSSHFFHGRLIELKNEIVSTMQPLFSQSFSELD